MSSSPPTRSRSKREARRYLIDYTPTIDAKEVITRIMNGVDMCLIDPLIFPLIEPILHDYLDAFRLQKDDYNLKKMEAHLAYIREEPERQAVDRMLTMIVRDPPPKIPVLSQEQVDAEVDFILASEQVRAYPEDELDLVLEGLRQRRRKFIDAKDYASANKAEHLARIVLSHGQLSAVESMQAEKIEFFEAFIQGERQRLEAAKARWNELHKNLMLQADADFAALRNKHEEDVQELTDMKAQTPRPAIRKYSAELLQIRNREQALIKLRQFREAGTLRARGDALEARENAAIRRRWVAEIDARINNMRTAQARQVETRKAFWRSEATELVNQANREIDLAERQIQLLQDSLRNVESAKTITIDLKKENETRQFEVHAPVTGRLSPRERATVHGQRRILNKRIYTRTPKPGTRPKSRPGVLTETW